MPILINDNTARVQYTATSGQTVFAVPFEFFENSDLKVYRNSTLQTIATHYTLTGAGITGGGNCTFVSGVMLSDIITIVRDVPIKRLTDFPLSGPFNISALNLQLDQLTAMIQEVNTLVTTRVPLLAEFDRPSVLSTIPTLSNRINRYFYWDANGNPAATSSALTVTDYTAPGTGAVTRPVQSKLSDIVSVKDFGAVGNGIADDTAAILLAFQNGGHVVFPTGTYKVTTVLCQNVVGLTVDARSATFTSVYGNVFVFKGCDNFSWFGGTILGGVGANPAYPSGPEQFPQNFLVFDANRIILSEMVVINTPANVLPCITAWNVGQCQINNNQVSYGGDNSIWVFNGFHVTVSNNLVLNQERGRGICFQKVNFGVITGNVCANGKGDGCNVHGSSNIAITGNSIYDMAVDTVILGLSTGISIEWDENASPAEVAAAVADPQLYNNVFSRNITVSGNTISKTNIGLRIGNNIGITGSSYGNQGQVVIDGNNVFGAGVGILTGTSRQLRISNNMISTCNQACIELNMGTDTGGFSSEDVYISNNRFTIFNVTNTGYNAVQFQSGLPTASDRIILTNNEWDNGNFSAGFTNVSGAALAVMEGNTSYANGVATSTTKSALMVQRQFSDQAGASTLTPYLIGKATNEFTQSGQVLDAFVTVLSIPANASIAAQIQIGTQDRVACFGTIYAHNGTTPALTFTGTGAAYVQLSGGNLQISGNTSGGTVAYGGLYSIRYSLLNPS